MSSRGFVDAEFVGFRGCGESSRVVLRTRRVEAVPSAGCCRCCRLWTRLRQRRRSRRGVGIADGPVPRRRCCGQAWSDPRRWSGDARSPSAARPAPDPRRGDFRFWLARRNSRTTRSHSAPLASGRTPSWSAILWIGPPADAGPPRGLDRQTRRPLTGLARVLSCAANSSISIEPGAGHQGSTPVPTRRVPFFRAGGWLGRWPSRRLPPVEVDRGGCRFATGVSGVLGLPRSGAASVRRPVSCLPAPPVGPPRP